MAWAEHIHQWSGGAARRVRRWWLRRRGIRIGAGCWIQDIQVPRNPRDIWLADGVMLDRHVVLIASGSAGAPPRIRIHDSVYVNRFTTLDASESIEIGARTMIGPHCYLTDHDHGMELGQAIGAQPLQGEALTVGEDVWVGAGAILLKGVTVGDQAVIAAGAVVTKDVAAKEVVGGVPARVIKERT